MSPSVRTSMNFNASKHRRATDRVRLHARRLRSPQLHPRLGCIVCALRSNGRAFPGRRAGRGA
eukprot:9690181-Lingulodinium_polyedra.AAC.1